MLVATRGPLEGKRYPVSSEGLVLGRAETCDVPIPDQGVSREHARVMLHNAAVWVQDAGSRNGVYVNGKRVSRHKQLSPGAELTIGVHAFTLELDAEVAGSIGADADPLDGPPPTTFRSLDPGDATIDMAPIGDSAGVGAPATDAESSEREGPPLALVLLGVLALLALVVGALVVGSG